MKGLKKVAEKTKSIEYGNRATWVALYYSYKTDTVYTTDGEGRYHVCDLINENEPADVKAAVERWKRL